MVNIPKEIKTRFKHDISKLKNEDFEEILDYLDKGKIAKEAAKVMKYTDNSISLIANGSSYYEPTGKWMDWNRKVLTELRDVADFLSIHRYWERSEDYYVYMGQRATDIDEKITITAAQIEEVRKRYKMEKPIYISFDEWAPHGTGLLATLAVAQYFNSFIRYYSNYYSIFFIIIF